MKKILSLIPITTIITNAIPVAIANSTYSHIISKEQSKHLKKTNQNSLNNFDSQKLNKSETQIESNFGIEDLLSNSILQSEFDQELAKLLGKILPKLLTAQRHSLQNNVFEKYYKFLAHDLLKLTIKANTWMEIVVLFMLNLKEDFIVKLKNGIANFHKEDYSAWWSSITDNDISSFAYLIWENFSYYYNLFWNLDTNNQAVKIISYTGYEYGYWYEPDPSIYNEVLGKSNELENIGPESNSQQALNIAVQEKNDIMQCIGQNNVVEWSTRHKIKIKIDKSIWKKINTLFFINNKNNFISKLTNLFAFFPSAYNDVNYKLNLSELKSFAYLIWENFSYYYNTFLRLKNDESVRITSYIGYEGGYWQREYFEYYNKIVDTNNNILEWESFNKRDIKNNNIKRVQKMEDEFRRKRQTTKKPAITTPTPNDITDLELDKELTKLMTITTNKLLNGQGPSTRDLVEAGPSTRQETSPVLKKIDNYFDEVGVQQGKEQGEVDKLSIFSIINDIDKYLATPGIKWQVLKNDIEKNFNRRDEIESWLKNEVNQYFSKRKSSTDLLRNKINQYFDNKEVVENKSVLKKIYHNFKKPFKSMKQLVSKIRQEYEPMSCSQEYLHENIGIEDDTTPLLPVRDNFVLKTIILVIIAEILNELSLKEYNLI